MESGVGWGSPGRRGVPTHPMGGGLGLAEWPGPAQGAGWRHGAPTAIHLTGGRVGGGGGWARVGLAWVGGWVGPSPGLPRSGSAVLPAIGVVLGVGLAGWRGWAGLAGWLGRLVRLVGRPGGRLVVAGRPACPGPSLRSRRVTCICNLREVALPGRGGLDHHRAPNPPPLLPYCLQQAVVGVFC